MAGLFYQEIFIIHFSIRIIASGGGFLLIYCHSVTRLTAMLKTFQ
jgi:hypothetical protein